MMNTLREKSIPSRLRMSSVLIGRWLLHVGCRKQAFKHALLDASKSGSTSTSSDTSPDRSTKEVQK